MWKCVYSPDNACDSASLLFRNNKVRLFYCETMLQLPQQTQLSLRNMWHVQVCLLQTTADLIKATHWTLRGTHNSRLEARLQLLPINQTSITLASRDVTRTTQWRSLDNLPELMGLRNALLNTKVNLIIDYIDMIHIRNKTTAEYLSLLLCKRKDLISIFRQKS
jgi:hypothetical protein